MMAAQVDDPKAQKTSPAPVVAVDEALELL